MTQAEFEKYAKEHNIFYCTKELGEQIKVETPPILEQIKAEIRKVLDAERDFTTESAKAQAMALFWVLELIDKYAEQEQEVTVSVLPDENGYYPNVCGMCANAESELCDWCGDNKNFRKIGMSEELVEHYKKLADHYNIRRQRAEKKLKEVYEPKLKAGVTYFDEFAFDMKGEPNDNT